MGEALSLRRLRSFETADVALQRLLNPISNLWSWREESNLQPAVYKTHPSQFHQIEKALTKPTKPLMGAGSSVSW